MINRTYFFKAVRPIFNGRLTPAQVQGMEVILTAAQAHNPAMDRRWLAYELATTAHETAYTMRPIIEHGGREYFFRMYDPGSPIPRRATLSKLNGARPGDGPIFYGRGYVQLTWRTNYEAMGRFLGVDLSSTPAAADRALDPPIAARIMFEGMERGMFTGKKLADYFNDTTTDWVGARRIINGLDKAKEIGELGKRFLAGLAS
jgi:putative chitinase